jgi:hypothetical protein
VVSTCMHAKGQLLLIRIEAPSRAAAPN